MNKAQALVDAFNKAHKVGNIISLKMDDGTISVVKVKQPATVLEGHTAVGWFEEITGCYLLNRVVNTQKCQYPEADVTVTIPIISENQFSNCGRKN